MDTDCIHQLKPGSQVTLSGLRGASPAWLSTYLKTEQNCCYLVADESLVGILEQDLRLFTDKTVLTYPGYEIPPYTPLSPDQQTTASRLSCLYRLYENSSPFILVVSMEALMRRVLPKEVLNHSVELVMAGEDCDLQQLLHSLVAMGYEQVSLVRGVGDFSVRGGIVDIYPPPFVGANKALLDGPVRLDFFGETIESIRAFNPVSQRSVTEFEEALFLPVSDILFDRNDPKKKKTILSTFQQLLRSDEWDPEQARHLIDRVGRHNRFAGIEFFLPLFYPDHDQGSATLFDYLPTDTTFILTDPLGSEQSLQLISERIQANFQTAKAKEAPALQPSEIFLSPEQVTTQLLRYPQLKCEDFAPADGHQVSITSSNHQLIKQDISLQRRKRGLITPLADHITTWQNEGGRVIICCRSGKHTRTLAELFDKHHFQISLIDAPLDFSPISDQEENQTLFLCTHPLSAGFSLVHEQIHLLSESELFGEMRMGSRKKASYKQGEPVSFSELNHGDVVVHRDHGLGIYRDICTLELNGITNDFMLIEYRGNDKLYLPIDRLQLISRYEGLSDRQPKIDKLGSQSWRTIKSKVKEEVWKVAQELLEIYATREVRQGRRFSPPAELYHELEESFPYDETVGQDKAITDTIDDLTSDKPMDRLVCGDVGYGKTEVAVRAAFKVVEDGFQVAILVPTTVLAEQHAKTFRERLQGFPVTVECINRFRTPAQQRQIVADLRTGKIDIIIGTHRLFSKDIVYQNLGLLVVDEEHRFGVSHKEKIKKIKAEVDILTLTATPIPRTLQMSLLGIRDLSVISSPPRHRRPVKTFVARFDELVIKEAIMKEMHRQGQLFFVHNRVRSIQPMARMIQELVPTARIGVAHGQMGGKELEEVMVAFVKKEIDVMVCTTIIESGLDIPSANTIIINRADHLGMAEIYQLRGRVGRSSLQSFAYLLVPSLERLSKDSKERLRALIDCNELGGGFKLAMSDLQIRGGGNLLGVSQSGHIAAIGYDLYLDLLQKTIADLKQSATTEGDTVINDDFDPEINLQISAYIPETYINDISQRYLFYRRISGLVGEDKATMADLKEELADRFGPLPAETRCLFQIMGVKKGLATLRINKLEKGRNNLVFTLADDTPLDLEKLLDFVLTLSSTRKGAGAKLTPKGRLILPLVAGAESDLFPTIHTILEKLNKLTTNDT